MTETVNQASAEHQAPEQVAGDLPKKDVAQAQIEQPPLTEPPRQAAAAAPALAPPPVAKLQRAYKAELLPPPPGVVSKRNRPKPAAPQEPSPAAQLEEQPAAQAAAQSSIEQGHLPDTSAREASSDEVQQQHQDAHAESQAQDAPAHPEAQDQAAPETKVQDSGVQVGSPEQPQALAQPVASAQHAPYAAQTGKSFQSARTVEPARKSKGKGMWLAIAGLLLLAGLTWWQLG